jgi:hypothetical protein
MLTARDLPAASFDNYDIRAEANDRSSAPRARGVTQFCRFHWAKILFSLCKNAFSIKQENHCAFA